MVRWKKKEWLDGIHCSVSAWIRFLQRKQRGSFFKPGADGASGWVGAGPDRWPVVGFGRRRPEWCGRPAENHTLATFQRRIDEWWTRRLRRFYDRTARSRGEWRNYASMPRSRWLAGPEKPGFFFASKDRTPFYSYLPVGDGEFCIEARLHPFFDEFVTKRFHSWNERRRVLIRQKNACKDENSTPFTWLTNFSLSDSINFAKIVYFFQVSAGI